MKSSRFLIFKLFLPSSSPFSLSSLSPYSQLGAARLYSTGGSSTLVVVEHDGKKVTSGSLASFTAAQKLGGSITAFVAGSSAAEVAKEVSRRNLFSFHSLISSLGSLLSWMILNLGLLRPLSSSTSLFSLPSFITILPDPPPPSLSSFPIFPRSARSLE